MLISGDVEESSTKSDSLLSIILVSGGLVSLIVTVLGIKLRWFRHRLTFEEPIDNPSLDSHGGSFEIRDSCARGLYRKTLDLEMLESLSSAPVVTQRSPQANNRESIFRWPFRSKLQFTNKTIKEDIGTISTLQSAAATSYEHEHNVEIREKNEKLKKRISERILFESSQSSSKQYRELSVDRDEPVVDVQQVPLPSKRTFLEVAKEIPIIPPVVTPRTSIIHKESIDDVTTLDSQSIDNVDAIQIENKESQFIAEDAPVFEKILPKSILKNSETNSNTKKIQFQDVSATDTSSEMDNDSDSSDFYEEDPWNLVDQHRNALNRKHRNSPSPPPPLPKSSPPSLDMDDPNKDYSLA